MRGRLGTTLTSALATLVLLAVVGLAFVYSGIYDVAATADHVAPVRWLLHTTMERSVAVRLDEVPEPPVFDSSMVSHGFEHYRSMCVTCHGAPGVDRGELGRGMIPSPPLLADEAGEDEPRELFWITKHGIKMAGMPAFGPTHSDEEIWGIVAFLEEMAHMSPSEYAAWEARYAAAGGEGAGGAGDHSHEPGTPSHSH